MFTNDQIDLFFRLASAHLKSQAERTLQRFMIQHNLSVADVISRVMQNVAGGAIEQVLCLATGLPSVDTKSK